MHKRPARLLMVALSLLGVLSLLLSACGPAGTPASPSTSNKPVKGGTWVDDLYEDASSLIPNASSETFSDIIDQTIWAPLFVGSPDGTIKAGIAAEVPTSTNGDISADLKTWTFKLRPNLKWSDGQPLTAKDIDYTWKLWNNPSFGAASTSGLNLITSADVSSDNLSITFHLKQAFAPFIAAWTDGAAAPLPEHIFSKISPANIQKSSENLDPSVSSGPFTVTESKPGTSYTVSRNPNYYQAAQGLPYLDKIVFRVTTDQNTILKDVQSGAVTSAWDLDVTKTPTYKKLSNYKLTVSPSASNFEAIYFNLKNPVLQDVNIRKAISEAIDHPQLIKTARQGQAALLCTDHASAYHPGYQADAVCPTYDPTAAKAILEGDGYKLGSDGVYAKNGKKLEFQYSTTSNNQWRAEDEDILQSELGAIGIKLDISNYPASTFFGTFLPQGVIGKYDLAEFEDSFTYDADDSSLEACNQIPTAKNSYGGENYSFYCNPALDKLFTQEQTTADPTARQAAFNQIHQIYLTAFPFITLYAPEDLGIVKNTGNNYNIGDMGSSETVNVWNWYCTGGKC
jgi:peptide/nickel transport system substrate-binding protein